jgi:phosphatidylglycerophosphate synthase
MYLTNSISAWFVLLVVGGIQGRLVCNLLDGMVAVEYKRQTAMGGVWNELPDRITDTLFLVGSGYAFGEPMLGWVWAFVAALTAYIRLLGLTCGTPAYYVGPLAKQQRMAVLTCLWLVSPALLHYAPLQVQEVLHRFFLVVIFGTILTCLHRYHLIRRTLCATNP